jgi:hypothetical protein
VKLGAIGQLEFWDLANDQPAWAAANLQLQCGTLLFNVPTPSNPSLLQFSLVGGLGLRLARSANISGFVWYELAPTPRVRGEAVQGLLVGLSANIDVAGGTK